MKVLVDTNVLVSAILKDGEPERILRFIRSRADMEWIVSSDILKEYRDVIGRKKFGLPLQIQHEWFAWIDSVTTEIPVDLEVNFSRDPKDEKFLACAMQAEAMFFITGDHDFSVAQQLVNTKIVSVALFLRVFNLFGTGSVEWETQKSFQKS